MVSWASLEDAIWGAMDRYSPLQTWLTHRGGKKWKFTAGDKLPTGVTKLELPVLMVRLEKAERWWVTNAQTATGTRFAIEMWSDSRSQREALDFGWLVWQALMTEKTTNFGLANLARWTMEAGPLENKMEDRQQTAVMWKMKIVVTMVVVE